MYKGLWRLVNKFISKDSAACVYLSTEIIGWTVAVTLLGMAVCYLMRVETGNGIVNSMCAGIYAGIIFGLFGGILYLQRHQEET